MKRLTITLIILAFAGILSSCITLTKSASVQETPEAAWMIDYALAREQSIKTDRPMMIVFMGEHEWCPWCKALVDNVFSTQEFYELSKRYVMLGVDSSKTLDLSTDVPSDIVANVSYLPAIAIMLPDGSSSGHSGWNMEWGFEKFKAIVDDIMGRFETAEKKPTIEIPWMTDYNAALKAAKETNKPVLMSFVGLPWCGYCVMMEEAVFNTPGFLEYSKGFVLYRDVVPQPWKLDPALPQVYHNSIKVVPSTVVLDSGGKILGGFKGWYPIENFKKMVNEILNEPGEKQ